MPIARTTTSYTGRTLDLSILQYPDATSAKVQPVTPAVGPTGRYCSGVQKLAQRYAILLLSDLGSQPDYPTEGTQFVRSLQRGVVDRIAASQIFARANYNVVLTLQEYQSNTTGIPLDERITSARLTGFSITPGTAGFNVLITTEAGDNVTFVVPLPI